MGGGPFDFGGRWPVDYRYQLKMTSGTTLPANAHDGDTYTALVSSAVTGSLFGAQWPLVYNASEGVWYPQGATPLISEVDTAQNTTSASYADLATVGPTITLPFAGDYLFSFGAQMLNTTATDFAAMTLNFGGGGPSDSDATFERGSGTTDAVSTARHRSKSGLTQSQAITAKYRVGTGGNTGQFGNRWLNVLPLRIH